MIVQTMTKRNTWTTYSRYPIVLQLNRESTIGYQPLIPLFTSSVT